MRQALLVSIVAVILIASYSYSPAQIPVVEIVFDEGFTQQTHVCTPATGDSAYVVARNFNIWMQGIEFGVQYPTSVFWTGDTDKPDLVIGDTKTGISMVWTVPRNAYQPVKLCKINYFCIACPPDTPIKVIPHPVSGYVRAVRYPDMEFIYGIGWTSMFCPVATPVEDTTWGNVKALYAN